MFHVEQEFGPEFGPDSCHIQSTSPPPTSNFDLTPQLLMAHLAAGEHKPLKRETCPQRPLRGQTTHCSMPTILEFQHCLLDSLAI